VKDLVFRLNSDLESAHFALSRKNEFETRYQLLIPVARAIFAR
jgi:hypothetical protein